MLKTALIIGRFQPFHKGHLNLIKRYVNAGFFIKIAIGSSQKSYEKNNPLTKYERGELIRRVMKELSIKKYKIYYVQDIRDDSRYVKHVMKIVGKFDVILTGNPLIFKLFFRHKSKEPWDIETFSESSGRPGGKITASIIRKKWSKAPNRFGLSKSSFDYLKSINFSERVNRIKN